MSGLEPGRLIAFEGVDGCGKTTQARLLATALDALFTFEPGDTPLGATLRRLILEGGEGHPAPRTEALLLAADRAQHVAEVLRPALASGRWVVTDRYSGSTVAYQAWGRGLDVDEIRRLVRWAADGLDPDLVVLIDVPLEVARRRVASGTADRLERSDTGFFERVREGFMAQAGEEPHRWAVVDGTGGIEAVASEVAAVVEDRLGTPGAPGS